ncbi:cutinase-domain-containing protein [Podospora australis]|uniref:cutinase n=1 Tax=Podospora australis TaxID=1536484 RepID=A0AAN6WV23_9PEZI|nr:cutinase-domain-containing protein [Podospora australis]
MKSVALLTLVILGSVFAIPSPNPPQDIPRPDIPPPEIELNAVDSHAPVLGIIPVDTYLYWIAKVYPVESLIENLEDSIAGAQRRLTKIFHLTTTEDIPRGTPCADITVLFARGIKEDGNLGALVGPAFVNAIRKKAGNRTVAVQGTNYPSTIQGYLQGGDPFGGRRMTIDVRYHLIRCPKTKLVMSGYSNGALIVRNSATVLTDLTMRKVSSVVLFGDPRYPEPVPNVSNSKLLNICHNGDSVCRLGSNMVLLSHFLYVRDVEKAAEFVISRLGDS